MSWIINAIRGWVGPGSCCQVVVVATVDKWISEDEESPRICWLDKASYGKYKTQKSNPTTQSWWGFHCCVKKSLVWMEKWERWVYFFIACGSYRLPALNKLDHDTKLKHGSYSGTCVLGNHLYQLGIIQCHRTQICLCLSLHRYRKVWVSRWKDILSSMWVNNIVGFKLMNLSFWVVSCSCMIYYVCTH